MDLSFFIELYNFLSRQLPLKILPILMLLECGLAGNRTKMLRPKY
jgi:hypothetical protein